MIEIGRRGFITGLVALVAAPAIVRVESIMPISIRHTPLYVPASWLGEWLQARDMGLKLLGATDLTDSELRRHAWSRPMADNWVNVNDYDPAFVKQWARQIDADGEYWFS